MKDPQQHKLVDVYTSQIRVIFTGLLSKEFPKEYIVRYERKLNRRIDVLIKILLQKELNPKILRKLYLVGKSLMSMGITDDMLLNAYRDLKNILLEHPERDALLSKISEAMKVLMKPYIFYDIFNFRLEGIESERTATYLELINRLKRSYTSHFTSLVESRESQHLRETLHKAVEELKSNPQTLLLYEELHPYDRLYWRLVSIYNQEAEFEKSYELLKDIDRLVIGIVKFLDEFLVKLLSHLAFVDPLTGLYNRNFMSNALRKEMSLCKRHNLPISFVVMDVDDFKRINDVYGHYTGDKVLSTVGSIIKRFIRSYDVPLRIGGEEFLIILPNTSEEGGFIIAERIRKKVEECRIDSGTNSVSFTLSAGVSQLKGSESPEESIKRADKAMYSAKRMGKNRVVVASHEP